MLHSLVLRHHMNLIHFLNYETMLVTDDDTLSADDSTKIPTNDNYEIGMLSKAKVQGAEPLALLMVGSMERGANARKHAYT